MPLIYFSFTWVAGIIFGASITTPPVVFVIVLIPLVLHFFIPRQRKLLLIIGICLIAFFGGALYSQSRFSPIDENHLQFYNDKGSLELEGIIIRDPESGDKTSQIQVSASTISGNKKVSGTALLIGPRLTGNITYAYGDIIRAKGKMQTPPELDDFDYKGYLANQGIYSIIYFPEIEIVNTGQGFKPLALIYDLREHLALTLSRVLPEPQASLAQGIVLGLRGNIPPATKEKFIHTGTAHLLAISGMNLSIMAGLMVSMGIALFGRRHRIYVWLALIAIWFYALITGLHSPVVRAAIMASLFLSAELLGRQRSASIALILAATAMITINPRTLYDASFQMSFAAMAGLVYVFPLLQPLGRKTVTRTFKEREPGAVYPIIESFSISISTVIAVLPLNIYYFGVISWIGPVATLLAIVCMPAIIITGSITGVFGLFLLPIAQVVAWVAWLFLSYLLLVVNIFDLVPFSVINHLDAKWVWVYYTTFVLVLCLYHNRSILGRLISPVINFAANLTGKQVIPGLLATAILVWLTAVTMPDNKLHVAFLDVGQGDAILITKGNQQVLVDGGPSPEAITLGLSRNMPFWDRTIDLVILTHPHADHITGLLEVLKRYRVKEVIDVDFQYTSPLFDEWHNLIMKKDIRHVAAENGQYVTIGDIVIDILNPPQILLSGTNSDIDNNSIITRLKIGEVSFLMMADTQWDTEMDLITQRTALSSTILKVGHHGSATSTSVAFLPVVSPKVAVISVGSSNNFGHPDNDVMSRLEQKVPDTYRTDERGTI